MMKGVPEMASLLDAARKRGARATEVLLDERVGVDAAVERGRLVQKQEIAERRVLVRCWLDKGRFGQAGGDVAAGAALVDQAVALAGAAPEDPSSAPCERLTTNTLGLGIDDRRFPTLSVADRIDVILTEERGARGADRRVSTSGFRYRDRRIRRQFLSSLDITLDEVSTVYEAYGRVAVPADEGEVVIDDFVMGRTFASISSLPYGTVLGKRAVDLLGPTVDVSGVTRAMLPPGVTGRLFARLAEAFRYDLLESGQSLFSAGYRSGKPVCDGRVHLLDDGALHGGLRTRSFDDEGAPPVAQVFLREGVVDGRMLDLRTARSLDTNATGHLTAGALRPTNLVLRQGTRSMSALLSEYNDRPVLVVDHVDSWDGLDLVTGEFRCKAAGVLQQGQTALGIARGVQLSGNILDVLRGLVELASDTDRIGWVDAPGMLVDGFRIG